MYVALAKLRLAIAEAHSLKEKRMVVRRIKDRVRDRLGVAINEVGDLDIWQRVELGCAVCSAERAKALELLDQVVRVVVSAGADGGADVVAIGKDVITFDVALNERPVIEDGWVPDAWREQLDKGPDKGPAR